MGVARAHESLPREAENMEDRTITDSYLLRRSAACPRFPWSGGLRFLDGIADRYANARLNDREPAREPSNQRHRSTRATGRAGPGTLSEDNHDDGRNDPAAPATSKLILHKPSP
jgi:hypothetical protein